MGYMRSILLGALMVLSIHLNAQNLPLANEAAKLCQAKSYDAAKSKVAEAIASDKENKDAYTWYVAGFIYKECFKELELGKRESALRETAVDYLLKAKELDVSRSHTSNIRSSLKFLARTYFNDALLRIREMDTDDETLPEKDYHMFRKLMREAEPGSNLNVFDRDYHQQMGQQLFMIWQQNPETEKYADRSLYHYEEAVRMDTNDCMISYNIGVLHYNRAVFLYRSIGPETELPELLDTQVKASNIAKSKALPAMKRADELCPEHAEILRGLMYINKALEREADVQYFKDEIERLINEGKMKKLTPDK